MVYSEEACDSPVFGEVGPQSDDVTTQLSLRVIELIDAAVDRHFVSKQAAERRSEHVVQLHRVETVARCREMVLVDVRVVFGD